jgi:hypothetical protein
MNESGTFLFLFGFSIGFMASSVLSLFARSRIRAGYQPTSKPTGPLHPPRTGSSVQEFKMRTLDSTYGDVKHGD